MNTLSGGTSRALRYEDIVVKAFEMFPEDFALRGYPRYPDSSDIHKPLYGPLKRAGHVLAGNKQFRLTQKGLDRARQLSTSGAKIEKTAADMIVPFDRLEELLTVYETGFGSRGLDAAIWGHISDGNLHPNVIPRTFADVKAGKAAILEFGREAIRLGGAPLAEHGVGRNSVKQQLLEQLYGKDGIAAMRAVKNAIDPDWKLAPGVLFART